MDVEGTGGFHGGVLKSRHLGGAGDRLAVVLGLCQEGDGAGGDVLVVAGLQPGLEDVDQTVSQPPGDGGRGPGAHRPALQGVSLS